MIVQDIVAQLTANAKMIENLVRGVDENQARWKPDEDRWSILEVVNHLYDEEIEDFRSSARMLVERPDSDWPAIRPFAWVSERSYNSRIAEDSLNNFAEERRKSLSWLSTLSNPDWHVEHSGSNRFEKPMRVGDLFVSWVAHDYFHIRQIVNLKWEYLSEQYRPFSANYAGPYLT